MEKEITKTVSGVRELSGRIALEYEQFRRKHASAFLIALSGIDASGKGYISKFLCEELEKKNLRVAFIPLDPWHHPKTIRFHTQNIAQHFYENAFRWDELFNHVILPLKQNKSIDVTTQLINVDEDHSYPHHFSFQNVDVILLEGIFLLKKELQHQYDFTVWIECSFETAMIRAIARNQEGLLEEEVMRDYNAIYFPAQKNHFKRDHPQIHADVLFMND